MPQTTLPWRTLTPLGPHGRLDPDAVTRALLEVQAMREARKARPSRQRRQNRRTRGR